jgi:hypothetical protein
MTGAAMTKNRGTAAALTRERRGGAVGPVGCASSRGPSVTCTRVRNGSEGGDRRRASFGGRNRAVMTHCGRDMADKVGGSMDTRQGLK